jgi:hypothetical protein
MPFSQRAKTIALAIVKIFETSKPFGDYSAVAVLDDGAGISYGISQFTHKSGSLHAVLERYDKLGGIILGPLRDAQTDFASGRNILKHSNNKQIRTALKNLGKDPLMQQAQREIAFEKYLRPALEACEGSNFVLPLSLAVIYDSINHGSYAKIRDRVEIPIPGNGSMPAVTFEKLWITEYTKKRDQWLESVPRLAKTDYRTDFFLAQIGRGNWQLKLPMNVHGFELTNEILFKDSAAVLQEDSVDSADSEEPTIKPPVQPPPMPEKEWTEGERPQPNVEIDKAQNVHFDAPAPTSPKPGNVTVQKVHTSIWSKLVAGVAIITGMGINFGQMVQTRLNEMTLPQLGYVLGAIALIALAMWYYERAQQRAHLKTEMVIDAASDTLKNNVKVVE